MLFSSLLDTGSKRGVDLELARALLQVLTLSANGAELTALHAINSSLILDVCAPDSAFRALVEKGAIRFRRRYDGMVPIQLLEHMLSASSYVFLGAWPELIDQTDQRHAAAALLRKETPSTGDVGIDARMDRVRSLLGSIEVADRRFGPAPTEVPYRMPYQTLFEERIQRAFQNEPGPVSIFLNEFVSNGYGHRTRTDLYREIRQRAPDAATQTGATEFADAISNVLVAQSLEAPLHTGCTNVLTRFAHTGVTSHGSIVALGLDDIADVRRLNLSWRNILAVAPVAQRPLGPAEIDVAIEQLSGIYARRAVLMSAGMEQAGEEAVSILIEPTTEFFKSPKFLGRAAGVAAGIPFAFAGPLAGVLFAIIGSVLGGILVKSFERSFEARRVKKAHKILSSFMDKLPG